MGSSHDVVDTTSKSKMSGTKMKNAFTTSETAIDFVSAVFTASPAM